MKQKACETGLSNTQFPAQPGTIPHLDYLTVALPWRSVRESRRLWKEFVHHPTIQVERGKAIVHGGIQKYPDSFTARDGAVVGGLDERVVNKKVKGFGVTSEKEVRFFARFSGRYFEGLDADQQYEFLCKLYAAGFHCTRIDLAVDIPTEICPFTMKDIDDAWENDHFTGFGKKDRISSGKVGNPLDNTYYFGSRLSAKLLRIYLHNDVPRIELECKAGAAKRVFESLTAFDTSVTDRDTRITQFLELIQNYALGATDFKNRSKWELEDGEECRILRAAYRSAQLQWWTELLKLAKATPVKIIGYGVALPSYSRTLGWIERQCAKSLWLLQEFHKSLGWENSWKTLQDMVNRVEEKAGVRDRRKLRIFLAEQSMNEYPV